MEGRSLSREDKATLPTLMEGSGVPEDRLRLLLVLYLHPGLFGSFFCVLSVAHASCQGCECYTADLVSSYDRPVCPRSGIVPEPEVAAFEATLEAAGANMRALAFLKKMSAWRDMQSGVREVPAPTSDFTAC